MNDKGLFKQQNEEEDNNEVEEKEEGGDEDQEEDEEEKRNAFNSDLLINIPPDEESGVNEITYGINDMQLNQYQFSTKSNIDNPNQFIPQSLFQKLEANTPMATPHDEAINLQQDYLKINLRKDSESGTAQMVATTPIGVETIQEKKESIAKLGQGQQGSQSPNANANAKKTDSYFDKSKSQQFKNNTNRQPNNTSPIYSYFNTSQKILSEFLFQNEDSSRERSNFVKKLPYDKTSIGGGGVGNYDQKNEGNSMANPLMNMNFNFFNKNVNDLLNSPVKSSSPPTYQQENQSDKNKNTNNPHNKTKNNNNSNSNNEQKYIDPKSNYALLQQQQLQYNHQDSDEEVSPQYQTFNMMNKQTNSKAPVMNYPEDNFDFNPNPNPNANNNKQFPFQGDFDQDFMMQQQPQTINSEEYIFEKFQKRGWECEKCNNFNFETRVKCNRCGVPMQPKLLSKIKKEGLEKSEDKRKKPLKERQGDWSCPKCRNLNFAFRQICNRCQLPKSEAQFMVTGMPSMFPTTGLPNYPNAANPGFNYVDSQNMINGNINIHNYFNMNNKGMLCQNMNMIKYLNDPIGNASFPQYQLDQPQQPQIQQFQQQLPQQQFQGKKGKSTQIVKPFMN